MTSMAIEIKITTREIIKPSSPTPHHLRNFKLSLLDQITPAEYAPLLLFYTVNNNTVHHGVNAALSQRLKTSLSETLTRFYPFAGKVKDHVFIDCNDDGVEYVEAQANCLLVNILQQPDYKFLREFLLPVDIESPKAGTGPMLLVQATFFNCGGVAIGICSSHKPADGSTISTLINSWASIARESDEAVFPEYVAASVFPPDDAFPYVPQKDLYRAKCVMKSFVFNSSKISALKTKVASAEVPKPTRVEALTALIWKCTTTASRSNRGSARLSLLLHAVNLRKLVVPPMPETSVGNAVGYFSAQTREREIELQDMVCHLRKAKEEFRVDGLQTVLENKRLAVIPEAENLLGRDDVDIFVFSCLSRFSLYEADFGWGRPIWVTSPNSMTKNLVILMETRDGEGMEALVSLSKDDMSLFEQDPLLLAFADLNHSVFHEAGGKVVSRLLE